MASDLLKTLDDIKSRWMIGGSALEKVPPSWRAVAASDPHSELVLLALAGQAMQFALQTTPGAEPRTLPPLPGLDLPAPPPEARQQFRNLVRVIKLPDSQIAAVIHLLAARGYVVHPTDYMPKDFHQAPDVYAPWASWHRAGELHEDSYEFDTINADNWDGWMPAERRAALSLLRRKRPEDARKLVAEKVPSLPAEERLRIIQTLGPSLGTEDRALLEGFTNDRSGKVRQLVAQYLARIGAAEDEAAEVAEYAEFFSVAKRRVRGGYKVTAKRLKTNPQRKRRGELAAKLSLRSVAEALQLGNEVELLNGWEHVDDDASDEMVRMVAATGSDQAVSALASRITSLDGISSDAFQLVLDRLSKESRRELIPRVLEYDDASFSATVVCARGLWGEIPFERLKSVRALKELKKLAGEDHSNKTMRLETLRDGLFSLGLLADQAAAMELLELFTGTNLYASDPMLGTLKLNACLPPGELL